MFKLYFGQNERNCAGMSRRNFLQVGGLGFGGLTLANLLAARASASGESPFLDRDTSVVWLWLNGGPTHIETFDPKMTAPAEFRSISGEVGTTLPGVTLGGHFEQLARQADKMAFVRSFEVPSSSHNRACFWVNTGYGHTANRPSLGSIASRTMGPNHPETGIPTYVQMGRIGFNDDANKMAGPAWLGQAYSPFTPEGPARENMELQTEVVRLDDRQTLLSNLDRMRRDVDANGLMQGIDGFNQQAIDLMLGSAAKAFDLDQEDPRLVSRYGKNLGESLLMARRLCEAGCRFVAVSMQGWDMHGNIARGLDRRAPEVDRAVSAFVEDLYQRGLDEKILFVISGEFGRTPRINKRAGRDHWGQLSTLALSGGGLRVGQTVGESSAKAETPVSTPVTVQDLMATVFHVLGVPRDLHFDDPNGRPVPMLESGEPIADLI